MTSRVQTTKIRSGWKMTRPVHHHFEFTIPLNDQDFPFLATLPGVWAGFQRGPIPSYFCCQLSQDCPIMLQDDQRPAWSDVLILGCRFRLVGTSKRLVRGTNGIKPWWILTVHFWMIVEQTHPWGKLPQFRSVDSVRFLNYDGTWMNNSIKAMRFTKPCSPSTQCVRSCVYRYFTIR